MLLPTAPSPESKQTCRRGKRSSVDHSRAGGCPFHLLTSMNVSFGTGSSLFWTSTAGCLASEMAASALFWPSPA